MKLRLDSTQVLDEVDVGVELGNNETHSLKEKTNTYHC